MKKIKDPVSGFSHALGALLSIAALVLLIIQSIKYGETYDIVANIIFGSALILLYTFSSIYHLCNVGETATRILRKFDHLMIYVLIAGTYTPICLGPLRGGWGWSIFGVVWALAILGTILTCVKIDAPRWLTTSIYVAMGWIVIIAVVPMIQTFQALNALSSLWWLLLGGIFYTIGALIYGFKWPRRNNPHFGFHEIFHIFILLGSFAHFWFIFKYVILI